MREAAADLDFEQAARLRDEIKRLRATELAVVDDPTVRNVMVAQDPKLRRAVESTARTNPASTKWASRSATRSSRRAPSPRTKIGRPGMRGGWKRR